MPKITKTAAEAVADIQSKLAALKFKENDIALKRQQLQNKLALLQHKNGATPVVVEADE